MGKRYTKQHSAYVLKKKHQYINKGTIWERDWVTIGNDHQIEPGKRVIYYDGNFIFTSNNFSPTKTRSRRNTEYSVWKYDDVKDAKPNVNIVKVNKNSKDIRDFAYYGSASELFRTSVENIIKWFPSRITTSIQVLNDWGHYVNNSGPRNVITSDDYYELDEEERSDYTVVRIGGFTIDNPYNIDLYHKIDEEGDINIHRYLHNRYYEYTVNDGTEVNKGTFYDIVDYDIVYHAKYRNITDKTDYISEDYYNNLPPDEKKAYEPTSDYKCLENYSKVFDIILTYKVEDENESEITLYGYWVSDNITFVTEDENKTSLIIKPRQEIIDDFFNSLDDFEKQLLNLNSTPLYTNTFVTPYETDKGYVYRNRTYTWPSVDGYIIVNENGLRSYIDSMQNMTELMDELWCDNIWRCMTHEAIKNYDWTYTQDYMPGDEEEYVLGGGRIEKMVRVYGRVFDDIRRYVEGIKYTTTLTYDTFNNMPDAEISDKLNYTGWEIYSTIPLLTANNGSEEEEYEATGSDYLHENGLRWFYTENPDSSAYEDSDIEFVRTLSLSSKHILSTKGTTAAMDEIMALFGFGDDDYTITETYNYITPKDYNDTLAYKIGQINSQENPDAKYDDYYLNIPMGEVYLNDKKYIVPYFDQNKPYKGKYVYFQSKGGWRMVRTDVTSDDFPAMDNHYDETVPYLKTVGTMEELLDISPFSVSASDIYYVANLSSYTKYYEDTSKLSHFFYLSDPDYPESFSSWTNIDFYPVLYETFIYRMYDNPDVEITYTQYENLREDEKENYYLARTIVITPEDYDKLSEVDKREYVKYDNEFYDETIAKEAMYLDTIDSDEKGNNPHVGFGKYDHGETFSEYMENPFKYMIDNTIITDDDVYNKAFGYDVNYTISNVKTDSKNGKLKNLVKTCDGKIYETIKDSFFKSLNGYDVVDEFNYCNLSPEWQENCEIINYKITEEEYNQLPCYYKGNDAYYVYIDGVTRITMDSYIEKTDEEKLLYTCQHITGEEYDKLSWEEQSNYTDIRGLFVEYTGDETFDTYLDELDGIAHLENELKDVQLSLEDSGSLEDVWTEQALKKQIFDLKYNRFTNNYIKYVKEGDDKDVIVKETYDSLKEDERLAYYSESAKYYLNDKRIIFRNNLTEGITVYYEYYYYVEGEDSVIIKKTEEEYNNLEPDTQMLYTLYIGDKWLTEDEYDKLEEGEKKYYKEDEKEVCNKYFKQYFFDVISKYLLQVVPSTAIITFEGFTTL